MRGRGGGFREGQDAGDGDLLGRVISVVLTLILVVAAQRDRVLSILCVLCGAVEGRLSWRVAVGRLRRGLLLVVTPIQALAVVVHHVERGRGR